MLFKINFIASAPAYDHDMPPHKFLTICDSDQSRKKRSLAVNGENMSTELTTKIKHLLSI